MLPFWSVTGVARKGLPRDALAEAVNAEVGSWGCVPIDGVAAGVHSGRDGPHPAGPDGRHCPQCATSEGGAMSSTRSRHDIRTDARGQFRVTMHPADAPKSLWVGLVVGLLAFVVRITSQTMYTAPGVSECSFTDYG